MHRLMPSNDQDKSMTLGRTDLSITPLGVGTWAWGDRRIWGYGYGYGEADLRSAFEVGLASGINLFDTAEIYGGGQAELFLGRFIKTAKKPVVIASKFMPYPWRVRRGDLICALTQSLNRLGLTRVDLYQIHWPLPPRSVATWVEELAKLVELGLVCAAGVSNYNAEQTRQAHEILGRHGIPLASNQVSYSLLDRACEHNGVMETCRDLGITLIAYSPMAMGILSGKYTAKNPPPGLFRGLRYRRKYLARIQPLIDLMRQIGQSHGGRSPAQVALNWVICSGAVPIPGAKNAQQAHENAAALEWKLTTDQLALLDAGSHQATAK